MWEGVTLPTMRMVAMHKYQKKYCVYFLKGTMTQDFCFAYFFTIENTAPAHTVSTTTHAHFFNLKFFFCFQLVKSFVSLPWLSEYPECCLNMQNFDLRSCFGCSGSETLSNLWVKGVKFCPHGVGGVCHLLNGKNAYFCAVNDIFEKNVVLFTIEIIKQFPQKY